VWSQDRWLNDERATLALFLAKQGKLLEAEDEARRALLGALRQDSGRVVLVSTPQPEPQGDLLAEPRVAVAGKVGDRGVGHGRTAVEIGGAHDGGHRRIRVGPHLPRVELLGEPRVPARFAFEDGELKLDAVYVPFDVDEPKLGGLVGAIVSFSFIRVKKLFYPHHHTLYCSVF
jgi:hypothetical protein